MPVITNPAPAITHSTPEPGHARTVRRYDRHVKIELDEVRRVAALARLDLEETEVVRMADQLTAILTYMEALGHLDTNDVEPTFRSVEHEGPFREDRVRPGLGAEAATRGAPPLHGRARTAQFLVPKVL